LSRLRARRASAVIADALAHGQQHDRDEGGGRDQEEHGVERVDEHR
jgi:hypothetical protein